MAQALNVEEDQVEDNEIAINSHVSFQVILEDIPPPGSVSSSASAKNSLLLKRIEAFVVTNFLPLGFAVAAIVSLSYPLPGKVVGSWKYLDIGIVLVLNNMAVFFISGLTLNTAELSKAISDWRYFSLGLLLIIAVTPCLAFIIVQIPFHPPDFGVGLTIFSVVPTTLGVGVALTAASGGNQALALLLTVSTNIIGVITAPLFLQVVLSSNSIVVQPGDLIAKLLITVLVPSLLGAAVRRQSCVLTWVTMHRQLLSLISTSNLVILIWQNLSAAAVFLLAQDAVDVLIVLVASVVYHIVLIVVFYALMTFAMVIPIKERIALVVMSAQKSAPVAVTIISYITSEPSRQGLLIIPALIGQLAQIFIGSALIGFFKWQIKREAKIDDNIAL